MSDLRLTEQEWRLRDALRQHWHPFCDADPVPENFIDDMDVAGLVFLRRTTCADLSDPFAAERGIQKGGWVWDLTAKGREALTPEKPDADR